MTFETRRPLWRCGDDLAEGVGEGERVLGVGVNDEGGEVDEPGAGFVVDFVEGDVEDGAAGLAQIVVRDVGGDADDLVEGLIGAAFERCGRWGPGRGKTS